VTTAIRTAALGPAAFREAGSGIPVVLLHAFPLAGAMCAPQLAGLAHCCRIIAPDFRGFGGSPLRDSPRGPVPAPSLDLLADDVAALLDSLGIRQAVVCGISMGGYVAMAMLRRHRPRLRAVVLAGTKAGPDTAAARTNRTEIATAVLADGPAVLVERVFPQLLGRTTKRDRPEVAGAVQDLVQQVAPESAAWALSAMRDRPDSGHTLQHTKIPALVVVGAEDELYPRPEAAAIVAQLAGAELVEVAGAGHLPSVEDPEAFNAALGSFIATLSP
jgi:pimeloyl-ACP methyl ester carboxylesterase